ncbi:hypothetical protein [Amycolatopsis australiensis]|uniref:hypothetical protein n=1 Tax=Amycolatopsis australiensis TaxID=546364 RepID=UPI000930B52D|nr:hypothetical protein [Amycolatopsis australiensis]
MIQSLASLSIPPRQHDLLADILLDAVLDESDGEIARNAALRAARRHGETLGATERDQLRPGRLGTERALTLTSAIVERHGFEPDRETPTCLRLRNCPFHPLAMNRPGAGDVPFPRSVASHRLHVYPPG